MNIARSQVGFINFCVKDLFESLHKLIPKVKSSLDRLYENRKKWESLFDECEVQMKKGYNLEKTL